MAFPARDKIYYCPFIFILARPFQRRIKAQCYAQVTEIDIKSMVYMPGRTLSMVNTWEVSPYI